MHASIAVCVMMVGGWVGPPTPESEVTIIPLNQDLSQATYIQDLEWKERVKSKPLPRVPTVDDRKQAGDVGRTSNRYPYSPNDPRFAQPRQPMMPQAPTSPDHNLANQPLPSLPSAPGGGYGGGYQSAGPGGYTAPVTPRNDPYANLQMPGQNGVQGFNGQFAPPPTPRAMNVNNLTSQNTVDFYTRQYGLSSQTAIVNPTVAGGANKPFSDYRPQNGFTPWQLLSQPTQNGTVSPYTSYVRPTMDQQNFNSHVSEQINGVQTQQRLLQSGTPGMEVPMGGAGLVNPQIFTTYR